MAAEVKEVDGDDGRDELLLDDEMVEASCGMAVAAVASLSRSNDVRIAASGWLFHDFGTFTTLAVRNSSMVALR